MLHHRCFNVDISSSSLCVHYSKIHFQRDIYTQLPERFLINREMYQYSCTACDGRDRRYRIPWYLQNNCTATGRKWPVWYLLERSEEGSPIGSTWRLNARLTYVISIYTKRNDFFLRVDNRSIRSMGGKIVLFIISVICIAIDSLTYKSAFVVSVKM